MQCSKCQSPIYDNEGISCSSCKLLFHFNCAAINENVFRKMRAAKKNSWVGKCCSETGPNAIASGSPAAAAVAMSTGAGPAQGQDKGTSADIGSRAQPVAVARAFPTIVNTTSTASPSNDLLLDQMHLLVEKALTDFTQKQAEQWDKFKDDLLDQLKSHRTIIESKVDKSMKLISNLTDNVDILANKVQGLVESADFTSDRVDKLEARICKLEGLLNEVEKVKSDVTEITCSTTDLKSTINRLEQRGRLNNLEIFGVPERKSEVTSSIVVSIAKAVGLELRTEDIGSAVRIATRNNNGHPRPIIAKLHSSLKKDEIISAVRKQRGITTLDIGFTGESQKINVNEHLTAENKNLLKQAKAKGKEAGFRYSWTRNAKIFLRQDDNYPAIRIENLSQLSHIKPSSKAPTQRTNPAASASTLTVT